MSELQNYQSDPNDALLELGPTDDDVMHWRAVMKGVGGTAYEGTSSNSFGSRSMIPALSLQDASNQLLVFMTPNPS